MDDELYMNVNAQLASVQPQFYSQVFEDFLGLDRNYLDHQITVLQYTKCMLQNY